jgi:hypothetical protein
MTLYANIILLRLFYRAYVNSYYQSKYFDSGRISDCV